jgi:hypothetical protein
MNVDTGTVGLGPAIHAQPARTLRAFVVARTKSAHDGEDDRLRNIAVPGAHASR